MKQRRRKINDGIRVRRKGKRESIKPRESEISKIPSSLKMEKEQVGEEFEGREGKVFHTKKRNIKMYFSPRQLIVFLLFIISLIFLLNKTSHTKVTIHPKEEIFSLNKRVNVKIDSRSSDIHVGLIHVADSEELILEPDHFQTIQGKAHGLVTVYNDYSTEAQRLLPHTRFLSASGKLFRSGDKEIIIPGKKNGKPGQIEVMVYADKPGEEYNIDLTDFTLPGFKEQGLTQKYDAVYAISRKKFSGGGERKEMQLSDKARREAEKLLEGKLKEKLLEKLFSQKTEELEVVQKGVQLTFSPPVLEKSGNTNFVLQQKGHIDALVYRKESVIDFLQKVAKGKVKSDYFSILPPQKHDLIVSYEGGQGRDFSKLTRIPLLVEGKYHIVWNINPDEIISELAGKHIDTLPQFIKNHPHIASFDLTISPFWKRTIHTEKEKIKVVVEKPYLVREGNKKKEAQ